MAASVVATVVACLLVVATVAGAVHARGARPMTSPAHDETANAAGRPDLDDSTIAYRLADTWRDAPWRLSAGRFRNVADVSSAPDGTVFVLDDEQGAVHVLSSRGEALRVFPVPSIDGAPPPCRPARLDAAPDGRVWVLGTCGVTAGSIPSDAAGVGFAVELRPDGAVAAAITLPSTYRDIAIGPDGSLVLARLSPVDPATPAPGEEAARPGGLDMLDARGDVVARFAHPSLFYPVAVDVGVDGTIYVANRVPAPWDYDEPGPQPTSLPAMARVTQEDAVVDAIVVLDAERQHVRTVPFTAPEDVAVGPAGAFVARNVEVFRLGEADPLYTLPPGQLVTSFSDRVVIHLDVPARGGLLAGTAHCYLQGVLYFERAVRGTEPTAVGRLDHPELRGPIRPARLAVDGHVALLQDRFLREVVGGSGPSYFTGPYPDQPQAVQQWTLGGTLTGQLGVCAGSTSQWLADKGSALWTSDVAIDGDTVYTLDRDLVKRRDGPLPSWIAWPGAHAPVGARAHLAAIAADEGHVAVLDIGTGSVVVLRDDGSLADRWALDAPGPSAVPGDIALAGSEVYIADTAQQRIRRYTRAGEHRGSFPTHIRPWRIDAGADGTLLALDRDGWAMRYRVDGALLAAWPMPDDRAQPVDVAAGPDGRVLVAYLETETAPSADGLPPRVALRDSGIWVFEPVRHPPYTQPEPGACWWTSTRDAEPASVQRGGEVTITTSLEGACPSASAPAHVVLLLDTSRSMNWDQAEDRARQLSLAALASWDPRAVDVALVTFDDEATLREPLTQEHERIAAQITAVRSWGDTRLADGLALAVDQLEDDQATIDPRRVVVVVSDGGYTDDARALAARAREAGVDVLAVALPHGDPAASVERLTSLTGDPARVWADPDADTIARAARDWVGDRRADQLFAHVEIADLLPANMRFVAGSGAPPPTRDGDLLRWSLRDVPSRRRLEIQYRLEPLELGTWPALVSSDVAYVDALGHSAQRPLRVPEIYVWDLSSLTEQVFLPRLARPSTPHEVQAATELLVRSHEVAGAPRLDPTSPAQGSRASRDPVSGVEDGSTRSPDDTFEVSIYLPDALRPLKVPTFDSDLHAARARYPYINGTRLNHCRLCHVMDERFGMNPYGRDYLGHDRDFAAIEPLDSDGDGFDNITEIRALTFPGWAGSRPARTR